MRISGTTLIIRPRGLLHAWEMERWEEPCNFWRIKSMLYSSHTTATITPPLIPLLKPDRTQTLQTNKDASDSTSMSNNKHQMDKGWSTNPSSNPDLLRDKKEKMNTSEKRKRSLSLAETSVQTNHTDCLHPPHHRVPTRPRRDTDCLLRHQTQTQIRTPKQHLTNRSTKDRDGKAN